MSSSRTKGAFFKSVLLPLLGAVHLFPDDLARVQAMDDDAWYPWDEYIALVQRISARVSPTTLTSIGFAAVSQNAKLWRDAGLATTEQILGDFQQTIRTAWGVESAPLGAELDTVEYRPGHAIIEAGALRPAPLVEGYIRAFITCWGRAVDSIETTSITHDGRTFARFTVDWI